jgi:signal transduction histidine kinase
MMNTQSAAPQSVRSLADRLFISAATLAAIILLIAGIVLSTLNHRNIERAFDARLKVYLLTLIADLDAFISDPSKEPGNLGDPRFNVALSGWYWQILKVGTNKEPPSNLKASRSLATTRLPLSAEQTGIANISIVHDAALSASPNFPLHIIERTIDFGQEGRFIVSIAADSSEVNDEKKSFDKALALTFLLLGAALTVSTVLQVRFGLAPLERIRSEISAIRRGDAEHIEGVYPPEIVPIAQELNQLVDANKEIIERSRTHVGNLAHALKTPLSVLLNEAENKKTPFALKVSEQIAIMRDQVQYYLDRARAAARAVAVGHVCEIEPVLIIFVRTFQKINQAKKIRFNYAVTGAPKFRGEKQDFEEMVGNLADNAGKWAKSKVEIMAVVDVSIQDRPRVIVTIDDDGPGLTQDQRFEATRRGQRLDETKPGSGLGLSIVVDLANVYGGQFTLDDSPLGGLRAKLELPAVI